MRRGWREHGSNIAWLSGLVCHACSRIQQGKASCQKCGQVVMGVAVQFEDGFYHDECFTCTLNSVASSSPLEFLTELLFVRHVGAACGIKVDFIGGFMNVRGSPWHPDCYTVGLYLPVGIRASCF